MLKDFYNIYKKGHHPENFPKDLEGYRPRYLDELDLGFLTRKDFLYVENLFVKLPEYINPKFCLVDLSHHFTYLDFSKGGKLGLSTRVSEQSLEDLQWLIESLEKSNEIPFGLEDCFINGIPLL